VWVFGGVKRASASGCLGSIQCTSPPAEALPELPKNDRLRLLRVLKSADDDTLTASRRPHDRDSINRCTTSTYMAAAAFCAACGRVSVSPCYPEKLHGANPNLQPLAHGVMELQLPTNPGQLRVSKFPIGKQDYLHLLGLAFTITAKRQSENAPATHSRFLFAGRKPGISWAARRLSLNAKKDSLASVLGTKMPGIAPLALADSPLK